VGVLFGFITGKFLSYYTVPILMLFFPLFFLTIVSFLPETPQCLLKRHLNQEAEISFKFYRNININGDCMLPAQKTEFDSLNKMIASTDQLLKSSDITIEDFSKKF
jgi:hypothetical protein